MRRTVPSPARSSAYKASCGGCSSDCDCCGDELCREPFEDTLAAARRPVSPRSHKGTEISQRHQASTCIVSLLKIVADVDRSRRLRGRVYLERHLISISVQTVNKGNLYLTSLLLVAVLDRQCCIYLFS